MKTWEALTRQRKTRADDSWAADKSPTRAENQNEEKSGGEEKTQNKTDLRSYGRTKSKRGKASSTHEM
jgi:hypothetical protein